MTNDTLADTVAWFDEARPNPTQADFFCQMGCHFEEVGEMIDALSHINAHGHYLLDTARNAIGKLAAHLRDGDPDLCGIILHPADRTEFLDAICDQIVTATGTAQHAAMDVVGGLAEVNRSNYSKFVDGKPIFKPNGKIAKGENYSEASLHRFV